MTGIPADLRARLEADFRAVRPLPAPWRRTLWVLPFALLAFVAAPAWFNVRVDAERLGWTVGWGFSVLQAAIGFALVIAGLRDAIPGREWPVRAVAAWLTGPVIMIAVVTWISWAASPIMLRGAWWNVWLVCFAASAATAMPAVAMVSILATRAYPIRPAVTGLLVGLGAGVMADGGWRMFCHYSEPAHVLSAHLGAVIAAAVMGSFLSVRLKATPLRP
jgi:hypothetical protein